VNSPSSATEKILHFYLMFLISSKKIIVKCDHFTLFLKLFTYKM